MKTECTVTDCSSKVLAKQLCAFHYHKAVRDRNKLRTCSVDGCTDPVSQVNLCMSHYHRHRTYGDPLVGGTRLNERSDWFKQTVEHLLANPSDECVLSPYSVDKGGYPHTVLNGKRYRMHHGVLVLSGRPLPVKREQVARHLCGNKRCVNPQHIEVGTYGENYADSVKHGTASIGARHSKSRLTEDDVRAIRASNERQVDIAARYGISQVHVSRIKLRRTLKHID